MEEQLWQTSSQDWREEGDGRSVKLRDREAVMGLWCRWVEGDRRRGRESCRGEVVGWSEGERAAYGQGAGQVHREDPHLEEVG